MNDDLFSRPPPASKSYTARDIEVLSGLEPVRRRPGMFIGGTDERALHHLAAEVLDNAVDEAIAGHATRIELKLAADGTVTVRDNGRGIPVDEHPKLRGRSALEVILTTLHSGGKFGGDAYATSGGLHGVGLSVVNALSDRLSVEVARDRCLWTQSYVRGKPDGPLVNAGPVNNRRGTAVSFHPDPEVFGAGARFRPTTLYAMARAKAYLHRRLQIRWTCDPELLDGDAVPAAEALQFDDGLAAHLRDALSGRATVLTAPFAGQATLPGGAGRLEWAVTWPADEDGFCLSYCNTIPTPLGGTHEAGLRTALVRGLKAYAEVTRARDAGKLQPEDVVAGAGMLLSVFIREPQFQGQTKEKLTNPEAARLVEAVIRDHFDHWLSAAPDTAAGLLAHTLERAEERLRRKQERQVKRQSATRRLRLPGKLVDCTREDAPGTELFLVEGDSAGGSAKQARERDFQAVLPLRGKILNVASASAERFRGNQELNDLVEALGCGRGAACRLEALRYEKIIIMTDADVDGAHIASLLITFFFRELVPVVEAGRLYLAAPPLFRLSRGGVTLYARDDAHRDELLQTAFPGRGEVEISRFKGLGEMPAAQLKATTMDPRQRTLLRLALAGAESPLRAETALRVDALMGRKPELRFALIREHARFVDAIDV